MTLLEQIQALERVQMAQPRGEANWPNKRIEAIATAAHEIIELAPLGQKEELVDAFTWGLDERD